MKKTNYLCMLLLGAFCLAGCGHEHQWEEATCDTAKTCIECNETEGEALDHNYAEATCTEPAICTLCGDKDGDALGHSFAEATCVAPETCSTCGETKGEPVAHDEDYFGTCELCGVEQYTGLLEKIDSKTKDAYYEMVDSLVTFSTDLEAELEDLYEKLGTLDVLVDKLDSMDEVYEVLGFRTLQDILVWMDSIATEVLFTSRMSVYDTSYGMFEEAYNLCGDYEELKKLKETIKAFMDCVPRSVPELSEEMWAKYDVPFLDYFMDEEGAQEYDAAMAEWQENYMELVAEIIEIDNVVAKYGEEFDALKEQFQ